ncbi:von Willebrand factor type A domain-containing protein [Flavobacterium buctense]|uniref:von Willebrand factor type A domain-containing protein n=1 Tax=Flavobacterium buctense TaxID=1648146 RepID=A0ABU9DZC7_9FLAO|nr:VWA domain-containing protein [Flavobacterium buctense]
MKNLKKFSLGIAMLITFLTFGQDPSTNEPAKQKTITGIVSDKTGPLPGANVIVKGTQRSTQTNFDGKYSINAMEGELLIFSFTGYNTKSVKVGKSTTINVILEDGVRLDEVVVEGYRNTTKSSTVVAQSTVSRKTIQNRPNASYSQTLQGQVAGLQINHSTGAPGTTVVIRGNSTWNKTAPLYVVDGVPVKEEDFRMIKADDINSINVLKDAAATSIYGNRATSGVVVIKTKTGVQQNLTEKELKKRFKEIDKATTPIVVEPNNEEYDSFVENAFESPKTAPLSTFSIDVDNASYTNVRRFINSGQTVPKDAVRVEEMVNFFKYQYPQPTGPHPFSINTEYNECPWNTQNKLVRIGLQGKDIPTDNLPKSNLVFLIDVSGSMSDMNKLPLLKESLKVLVAQLREEDKLAIVVYAGAAGLVLPSTSGSEKQTIIKALDQLQSGGSTAGGAGIQLAYKTAEENFIKGGNNRVILATDGDFNVGASSDSDMQTLIEDKRKSGVFLTCLGYGMGNYKDSKLETLADKGNGNYAYIDNIQEANRFLGKEFKGSMFAIAKDVKIQIEFNPAHVKAYRLIGYENRKLRPEDFKNDAIDAGELGSGHTVTALYEIIPTNANSPLFVDTDELKYTKVEPSKTKFNDELATIKFRYKKPDGDKSIEMVQVIDNKANALETASSGFKFSTAVAWFGLKLRDSKLVTNKSSAAIKKLALEGLAYDNDGYKAEFIRLVEAVQ